jgi:hypothetical protein
VARLAPALFCGAIAVVVPATATTPLFRPDDPLVREPETQDASRVQPWTIDLFVDLAINLFGAPGDRATDVRARNVNTIDEVPDSSWFTNRLLAHAVTLDAAADGPAAGRGPAPGPWTVIAGKEAGVAPGFTIADSSGERWFVSFDAHEYPEAATVAIMVANRIFWTLGYWQIDNVLTRVHPEHVLVGDTATVRPPSGKTRRMRRTDLDAVWRRAHRSADGTFRAVAARHVPGRPLGGFRFHGTRPDDPNDIVPHEHRRELRALKVFGAWTNLVDMKAGNTLDVLVADGDRALVRHYLQDVGSTFGTGALAPREFDEGWEHLYEPDVLWRRLASLGFVLRPWQTVEYDDVPTVGRFEGVVFNPTAWRPRVPTAALRHAQADDLFWAARRVAAFSDALIRGIVRVGGYSDPDAERLLADVLIQRRDKIAAAYLPAVNPVVNLALSDDAELTFDNAAVMAGAAANPRGYRVRWGRFDNATGAVAPLGETVTPPGQASHAPAPLPAGVGAFVRVEIEAIDPPREEWRRPLRGVFRRDARGWRLVGLERTRS